MYFHLVLRFQLKIVFFFFFCREERFIPISSNGVHPRGVIWHRNRKCLWGKRAGELRKGHCDHRQLSPRRARSVIGDECTSVANSRVFPSPAGKAREAAIGKIVKDLSVSSFIFFRIRETLQEIKASRAAIFMSKIFIMVLQFTLKVMKKDYDIYTSVSHIYVEKAFEGPWLMQNFINTVLHNDWFAI